ncbi:MAG: DUF308 domain-containing protein [Gordonia sp. (in: high G+C Gram-positive bacteria)]|uniref:HdeD family acid-resistance protein n=1 Tax=Gordonia sp. (in: high G+C Gram-positive bacteria) TaxID=84139 RepID=UPI003BB729E9
MTTIDQARPGIPGEAVNAVRSGLLFSAIVGIVLGALIMFWSDITVFIAGLLFGIALIVAGLYRLFFSFAAVGVSFAMRMLTLVFGILMVLCGVVAVISPEDAWWMLAIFIGVGWIFSGFQDIFGANASTSIAPRWLVIVGGAISVIAGIVMLVYSPGVTLPTIMWLLGLMLIIVSVVTLFTLPKAVPSALS